MMRFLMTVTCLTVLGLLLAGCAPAPTPTPKPPVAPAKSEAPAAKAPVAPAPPAPSPKSGAEQPRYGGVLSISHVIDPPSLDMHQEIGFAGNVLQSAYSGLTQFNPQNPEEVIGDLARSWEVAKDGLTYTFRFHENVKFHDGSAFTAEDARFSFERMMNPPRGILSPRRAELSAIGTAEAADKDTLKFILKQPAAALLNVLSQGYIVIYSKAFVEKKGHMKNDIMGTGPYKLKSYAANISLEYVKNPDYFVKGRPYLDGITFYIIRDTGTRLAAFRSGRVKLTGPGESGPAPSGAETIKRTLPQAVIMPYPANSFGNFILNTTEKPWNDIRARKAVHLAIDRQKAIDVLGEGFGEIGTNMPGEWGIPKRELEKMPGWRQPKDADIAEAKRLLAEAGYPDGVALKSLVRAERTFEQLSTYVADQLAKIGIKLELDVKELAVRQKLVNEGAFNSHATMNSLPYPDPENLVRLWAAPAGADWGMNWARLRDDKIFDLLDKQSRALDPAERKKLVRELDLRMIEVATRPVVWWKQYIVALWPEVKGYGKRNSNYSFERYQDIWLAK
ncbi:MAG: ABC transporter substrate-binding protein [Chloroflexi bacterium]|nr:ABC transporter substrate-binding protein [Chloroflexota bacterium]